jgi:glutamate carboxypeptidase
MDRDALQSELARRQPEMVESLRTLVNSESPSARKDLLDPLAAVIADRFRAIGGEVAILANAQGGDHVRVEFASTAPARPILLLGHFDTVWPSGTLAGRPFRVEDGRAFGPGVYDMKASLVLAEYALRAIRDLRIALGRPIVLLFTSDEEIGSPTSRALIEDEARASEYVLVLEPPLANGALKTARKGVGWFTIEVTGRAAHAGVEPEKGISAVLELAHQILTIHALNDLSAGTTVSVGVVRGGTVRNVIPEQAVAEIDVRVSTLGEASRIEAAMQSLRTVVPGATHSVRGGINRPPMERTAQVIALFEQAQRIGRTIGLELAEGATGGGSDANFTAALGVPTLDGLGMPGAGAHAEYEHVIVDAFPERAALLALLLLGLGGPEGSLP